MINKIYVFGTSFSEGGGFEFDIDKGISYAYNGLGEVFTKENFSFPGQLRKLLPNIEIVNLSKSGYGNERMYRLASDIVFSDNFDVDNSLFIFDFSHLGRKEYFSRKLNKHIVLNYDANSNPISLNGVAQEYNKSHEEYQKDIETLPLLDSNNSNFFSTWVALTYNEPTQHELCCSNATIFLSFLKSRNVKYLFTDPPYFINHRDYDNLLENHYIKFQDKASTHDYYKDRTITNETDGYHEDEHYGLIKNKLIASCIYDELIKRNMISGSKLNKNIKDFDNIQKIITKNTNYLNKGNI